MIRKKSSFKNDVDAEGRKITKRRTEESDDCVHPEYLVFTWVLCLIALATTLKLYFLVKTFLASIMVAVYTVLTSLAYPQVSGVKGIYFNNSSNKPALLLNLGPGALLDDSYSNPYPLFITIFFNYSIPSKLPGFTFLEHYILFSLLHPFFSLFASIYHFSFHLELYDTLYSTLLFMMDIFISPNFLGHFFNELRRLPHGSHAG